MADKVLIVDDDVDLRSEVRDFLEGYEVVEAPTGKEALNILKMANEIGVVLLDVMMPGLNGIDVLNEIKRTDPNLGIIIFTGHSSKDVAIEALKGHADDYVEKPLDVGKIKEVIERVLEAKRNKGENALNISNVEGKIERVKRFAEKNCYKKTTLKEAAEAVCLSPKYLSRIFKENTGVSFSDYRLKIKIQAAKELLGKSGYNINQISDKLGYQNAESFIRQFKKLIGYTPAEYRKINKMAGKRSQEALKQAHDGLELKAAERTEELRVANRSLHLEIAERKEMERRVRIHNALLRLMQRMSSGKEYLDAVVNLISNLSRCRYVGIRVLNEQKEIPYEAYVGFSREFWKSENCLTITKDKCACIRVIRGELKPWDVRVATKGGSFHCANIFKFMAGLSEKEKLDYRRACLDNGFTSVTIIPIHYQNTLMGAIHIADKREGKVRLETVKLIESLIPLIGEGINKFNLADKIQKAQKDLAEAKRLSDIGALAATVAHELRNPLGVIRTAAYNIKRKAQNPLLESHLANIEKKILESEQIISNLLFYSRIKTPHYEKVSIYEILQECVENVKNKFQKPRVSVRKRYKDIKNTFIEADSFQIKEVFINILNNAYEAILDKEGQIKITAGLDQPKGEIKISFSDNGIGIIPEHLPRIYEPFFTTKAKGTGLGLTVCSQIIGLHNGKISVKSTKAKGTNIIITLPLTRKTL